MIHYEVDEVLQNKVVELAKEKLEWLKDFKQKNGGVDRSLDRDIEFFIEIIEEDYIKEYSTKNINEKCCKKALEELSENTYYQLVCYNMSEFFKTALCNKLSREAPNSKPTVSSNFNYNFGTKNVCGHINYLKELDKTNIREVVMSMEDMKSENGKRCSHISILEDNRICFITYKKDKKDWNKVGDMIWDIDENKAIEKLSSLLISLKDNKYKICVFYKGWCIYIFFDKKDEKFSKFILDCLDYYQKTGNRLIEKIKRGVE